MDRDFLVVLVDGSLISCLVVDFFNLLFIFVVLIGRSLISL